MLKYTISFVVSMFIFLYASAQESNNLETLKQKVSGRVFTNYHTSLDGDNPVSGFAVERAYFKWKSEIAPGISGKVRIDIESKDGDGKDARYAFFKTAALEYKRNKLNVNFGMISTVQMRFHDEAWGRRYISKVFMDRTKLDNSADLGLSVEYQLADNFLVDCYVYNGEGYKKMQSDNTYDAGGGFVYKPIEGLTLAPHLVYARKGESETKFTFLANYKKDNVFSIGAEYYYVQNQDFVTDQIANGFSVMATGYINDKFNLFARYDDLDSNTLDGATEAWYANRSGTFVVAGLEYFHSKGLRMSINYQGTTHDDDQADENFLYLNAVVRF